MLIPILGRAGSGKTTWILDKVEQTAKQGGRVLLIVPEQFSFEMEKQSMPAVRESLQCRWRCIASPACATIFSSSAVGWQERCSPILHARY